MKLSEQGENLIKSFEGLRLHAYSDAAGVWTIGYGSTRYTNGQAVKPGDTLADELAASALFRNTLTEYESAVNNNIKVSLTQHQFDALVSLAYNVGVGVTRGTTIAKKLNAGDYNGAADQFLAWNKVTNTHNKKKITSNGLVKRREKERQYFLTNDTTTSH